MKSGAIVGQRGAGPGMTPEVEGILMPFSLIFVLEAIFAILAFILLLLFMRTTRIESVAEMLKVLGTHFSSSSVSNFFGFFGQHSQINTPCNLSVVMRLT